MTTSMQYFMLIAREQSIVRAAELLYITPQNLSNHIRRLEKEYGVLFERYPHFRLTPAGEALLSTAQQIQALEEGLKVQLQELENEMVGILNFGIHPLRAHIVLPGVMERYTAAFPNVHVTFHNYNMATNIRALQNGELDAFFGVDTPQLPEFCIEPLKTEPIWFVAARGLLEEQGISEEEETIEPEKLAQFRFYLSPKDSHIRPKLDLFLKQEGIAVQEAITISNFSLQMTFASQGKGACFTPGTVLSVMDGMNRTLPEERQLRALKVEGLNAMTNLAFVYHRLAYRSAPLTGFLRAFQETLKEI